MKKKVLFLCTGNSCRSQMAEGWARKLLGSNIEVYSAGTEPHGLNPYAVKAMKDVGVDISLQTSNHLDEYANTVFDLVVTVCNNAAKSCPAYPSKTNKIHKSFDDPPALAKDETSDQGKLKHYQRVRDEIKSFIEKLEI